MKITGLAFEGGVLSINGGIGKGYKGTLGREHYSKGSKVYRSYIK